MLTLLASIGIALCPAHAQQRLPENTGPNTNIVRTVTGKMTFRTISDGRVRGGEDFRLRPLETYASYWTHEGFKGSMYVTVSGSQLNAVAFGPKGRVETSLQVPQSISVVHHGEVMNGWYYWSEDSTSKAQQTSSVYVLGAAPRGDAQVSAILTESKFTRLGNEKVTTPAGTFDATHYQLAGVEALDMWIAGEDRLLVRQTDTRNDREYVLTEMTITPAH